MSHFYIFQRNSTHLNKITKLIYLNQMGIHTNFALFNDKILSYYFNRCLLENAIYSKQLHLSIDATSFIYDVLRMKKAKHSRHINEFSLLVAEKMFNLFKEYIKYFKCIYICFDGSDVPATKMNCRVIRKNHNSNNHKAKMNEKKHSNYFNCMRATTKNRKYKIARKVPPVKTANNFKLECQIDICNAFITKLNTLGIPIPVFLLDGKIFGEGEIKAKYAPKIFIDKISTLQTLPIQWENVSKDTISSLKDSIINNEMDLIVYSLDMDIFIHAIQTKLEFELLEVPPPLLASPSSQPQPLLKKIITYKWFPLLIVLQQQNINLQIKSQTSFSKEKKYDLYKIWPRENICDYYWIFIFIINLLGNDYLPAILKPSANNYDLIRMLIDMIIKKDDNTSCSNNFTKRKLNNFNIENCFYIMRIIVGGIFDIRSIFLDNIIKNCKTTIENQYRSYNWREFYSKPVQKLYDENSNKKQKIIASYDDLILCIATQGKNGISGISMNNVHESDVTIKSDCAPENKLTSIEYLNFQRNNMHNSMAHIMSYFISSLWYTCYVSSIKSLEPKLNFSINGFSYLNNEFVLTNMLNENMLCDNNVYYGRSKILELSVFQRRDILTLKYAKKKRQCINKNLTNSYVGGDICWYYFAHPMFIDIIMDNINHLLNTMS